LLDAPAPVAANAPAPVAPAPVAPQGNGQAHTDASIQILRDLILQGYKPGMDEDAVRRIVQEQVAGIAPHIIEVKHAGKDAIKIEGLTHPEFERALKYLSNGANIMLVGPAGCGKSYLSAQLAKALDVEFGTISGSAGVSESELNGWLLPADGGKFEYVPAQFIELYERGNALFCFDEMDAFDPNMLLICNTALANGHMTVAKRRHAPSIKRGANMYLMGTANTFGTGANPLYASRSTLDEATRDRFVFITVDYDKRLEESIGTAGGLSVAEMAGIWELRDKCREAQLRRVISTRAFEKAAIMKQSGDSWREIRDRLLEGWTKDERTKVGA
jgi:MoxR-like ATPase